MDMRKWQAGKNGPEMALREEKSAVSVKNRRNSRNI